MRFKRENDTLLLTFNLLESRLVHRVLRQLAANYRLKPGEMDSRTAAVWYSTRGCSTAKMSDEETREWLEHLHAFKSAGLQRLEEWSKQLAETKLAHSQLRMSVADAPVFITAINDHRLMAAARHDIGQREMDIRSPWELAKVPADRQEALLEIHFLAWVLEETLRALQEE